MRLTQTQTDELTGKLGTLLDRTLYAIPWPLADMPIEEAYMQLLDKRVRRLIDEAGYLNCKHLLEYNFFPNLRVEGVSAGLAFNLDHRMPSVPGNIAADLRFQCARLEETHPRYIEVLEFIDTYLRQQRVVRECTHTLGVITAQCNTAGQWLRLIPTVSHFMGTREVEALNAAKRKSRLPPIVADLQFRPALRQLNTELARGLLSPEKGYKVVAATE